MYRNHWNSGASPNTDRPENTRPDGATTVECIASASVQENVFLTYWKHGKNDEGFGLWKLGYL